jgi:hypothetical protein
MATSEFGKAFAAARKSGAKVFEFNGKKYNTRTADDDAKDKKASNESAQRGRSDMMKALTAAERNAPAGTSPLARQKIAESKAAVTRRYAAPEATAAQDKTDSMRNSSRAAVKSTPKATPYKNGGMVKGKC